MELLHDFSFLEQRLRGMSVRKCIALACPHDTHTEYVIERALGEGFARFVLTTAGPLSPRLARVAEAHAGLVDIVVCADAAEASREAVAVVRRGEADVLMKGTVNTDVLLRAVLDKQCGLLEPGRVMNHITMSHIPAYGKLLMFSDGTGLRTTAPRPILPKWPPICWDIRLCTTYAPTAHVTRQSW